MAKAAEAKRGRRKQAANAANMVVMAEHQAFAKSFDALFAAGMELIDKVSRTFGAEGDCAPLAADSAVSAAFYERERKRLGAVVVQIAAWLWLERAKRDKDMSAERVAAEKKKLALRAKPAVFFGADSAERYAAQFAMLPQAYRALSAEVEYFIDRIHHMDKETKPFAASLRRKNLNPVTLHWQKLHQAFGGKK